MANLLDIYDLKNLIHEATRITKTSETLLDLFLTDNLRKIQSSGVVHVNISDHSLFLPCSGHRNQEYDLRIILKEHDVVITDKKQMAELFNSYFVNIADGVPEITEQSYGKELDAHPSIQAIFNNNEQLAVRNKFAFQYTNKTQVEALLLKINSRKSCGHDGIPPRLVKESANAIAGPIAAIMNHSIRTGQYPSRWKLGQVTPLFKKDDELNKSNYRPVTVLPALNNVFERLLSAQMGDFYQNILSEYVSAYRRHHSCETSLLRLTEDWRRSLDNKEIVAVISMDLSKAFDTVPHALLLAKLKAYGLHDSSCALIGDYLTDRMQRVKIGDTYSDWMSVKREAWRASRQRPGTHVFQHVPQ